MAEKHSILTQERLKELLHYDPDTGLFTWVAPTRTYLTGKVAGSLDKASGYNRTTVDCVAYKSHRLAWLYCNGVFPNGDIDHINGIKHDNRICNLRDVSTSVNCQNQHKVRSDSTTQLIGAKQFRYNQWQAAIKVGQKNIHLGTFKTPKEAHDAYVIAKRIHHGIDLLNHDAPLLVR